MSKSHFSLPLALVDSVPVVLFLISCCILGSAFHAPLFLAGAVLCAFAGLCKVVWKILLAATGKDYPVLNRFFLPVMLIGFLLLVLGIVQAIHDNKIPSAYLLHLTRTGVLISLGIAVLFLLALIVLRVVFRKKAWNTSKRLNWAGEILNIGFQAAILSAVGFIQ